METGINIPIGDILTGNRLRLAEFQDYVLEIIYNRIEPAALLYGVKQLVSQETHF